MTGKKYIVILIFSFSFYLSYCQSVDSSNLIVFGKVVDLNQAPIQFALVTAKNGSDSSFISGTFTDEDGLFKIELSDRDLELLIEISSLIIEPKYLTLSPNGDSDLGLIFTESKSHLLSTIMVNAKRPIFENRLNKIIVNIEGSPLDTNTPLIEIIGALPSIEQNGSSIGLKGKGSGVQVTVDGKGRLLDSQQIMDMLSTLTSDQVEKIEIIRNPSSKYDASGGGVINIITKKNKSRSGVYGRYGQYVFPLESDFGNKYNNRSVGTSLNISPLNKLAFFTNLSYTENYSIRVLKSLRLDETLPNQNISNEETSYDSHYINTRFGVNYNISKQIKIDFLVNGYDYLKQNGSTLIRYDFKNENSMNIDSTILSNGKIDWDTHRNYTKSLYLTFTPENQNVVLYYDINTHSRDKKLNFVNSSSTEIQSEIFENSREYDVTIDLVGFDWQIDFSNWQLEFGPRMTFFKSTDQILTIEDILDISNIFQYEENIAAGYTTLSNKLGHFETKVGLRFEKTSAFGENGIGQAVSRTYQNFFPYVGIDYDFDKSNLAFNFNRRISRPTASDFNPNLVYTDPYYSQRGNQLINPEFTNYWELSYSRRGFTGTLSYSESINITNSIPKVGEILEVVDSVFNPGNQRNIRFYLSYPWIVNNNLTVISNGDLFYRNNALASRARKDVIGYKFLLLASMNLFKNSKLQATASYSSPFINGYTLVKYFFTTSIRYQVSIQKKLNLGVSITDLFGTARIRAKDDYGFQTVNRLGINNDRKITFSFRYDFDTGRLFSKRDNTLQNFGEKRY